METECVFGEVRTEFLRVVQSSFLLKELRYYLLTNTPRRSTLPLKPKSVVSVIIMSSILTLLESGHQNLHETYQCQMYSRKLLMMGREDARNV